MIAHLPDIRLSRETFAILEAVVCEPGEWTTKTLAYDLSAPSGRVRHHMRRLRALDLVHDVHCGIVLMQDPGLPPSRLVGPGRPPTSEARLRRSLLLAPGPLTKSDLLRHAGVSPASAVAILAEWRARGVLTTAYMLWPTPLGRRVVVDRLGRDDVPPVMPVRPNP